MLEAHHCMELGFPALLLLVCQLFYQLVDS